jgi:hypothetical protein
MSMINAPYGKLSYLILGYYPTVKDYFPEYLITLNQAERDQILKKLEVDAMELVQGINLNDPSRVTHAD